MAAEPDKWQAARLFPITGIGGAEEQERRGASALLAVMRSVREFGRDLTARCGAPGGAIETFIEVPFALDDRKFRPDGLIRVTRGQRSWTALVEVKTGRNDLSSEQVSRYLDIAKEQGFDAVVTISHQVATTPGVHPIAVDKRKVRRVQLVHLSWSRIHTEALIQQATHAVSDPDQAWILSEFVRYLEEPKSGALDFEDMGPNWVTIRQAATLQTIRAGTPETLDVVSRFNQLIAHAGMHLSRRLGVHVRQELSRAHRQDPAARLQNQASRLERDGQLFGSLRVPNAAAPIDITVDLRAARVYVAATIDAPQTGRAPTRVRWLLRQLKGAPPTVQVQATCHRTRSASPSLALGDVVADPAVLVENLKSDIRSFTLMLSQPAGSKRGKGKSSFVASVVDLVDRFYGDVLQDLKPWTPKAPQVRDIAGHQPASEQDPVAEDGAIRPPAPVLTGQPLPDAVPAVGPVPGEPAAALPVQ